MDKKIEIKTSAGTIVAEVDDYNYAPGIDLYFIPKGDIVPVFLAHAEVKECEGLRTDGESNEDVTLYVYGDPMSETFTDRIDYRRKDIEKFLENCTCCGVIGGDESDDV